MNLFKKLIFASTIGTYIVIFVGGLVRVSGAGLGCPDWPQCFGRWIPPTSIDQLPAHIDPSKFNFVLAWIEYINRLCGFSLGLLIATTAIVAIIYYRHEKKILIPTVASAFLVALLGLQGAVVITSELAPLVVTVHLLLALLMAALLIYASYQTFLIDLPSENLEIKNMKSKKATLHLGGLALLQILLGTHIRSKLEVFAKEFPLDTDISWLGKVGMTNHIHMLVGVLLGVFTLYLISQLSYSGAMKIRGVHSVSWALRIFILIQLAIGFTFTIFSMPELGRVFHMFIASLFFGSLVLIYTALNSYKGTITDE